MNKSILLVSLILAVFGVNGAQAQKAAVPEPSAGASKATGDEVVAKGQGIAIKRSQLDEAYLTFKANTAARGQLIPDSQREELESRLLDRLVITRLLMNQAADADQTQGKEAAAKMLDQYKTKARSETAFNNQLLSLGLTPEGFRKNLEEQAVCEKVIDRELKDKLRITETEMKKFYDDNPASFEEPEQVRAAHVLIGTRDPANNQEFTAAQKQEKKRTAEKVLARAKAGEDFAKLAKEFSDDPGSRDNGGEYTFPRGAMVTEFEAAAFSMKTNQVSDLVTTQFGYHIIKLHEKLPGRKVEFAKAEKDIKARLTDLELQKRLPDYLEKLKADAKVEFLGSMQKAKGADSLKPEPAAKK